MMKNYPFFFLSGIAAVAATSCRQHVNKTDVQKPLNILYIMTDDHSYQTISAYGSSLIQTPNIDRIRTKECVLRIALWLTPSVGLAAPVCRPADIVINTDF